MKTKNRMAAPDIIKIAATIFVIVIHHKRNSTQHFVTWYNLFFNVILALSVVCAVYMLIRALKSGADRTKAVRAFVVPVFASLSFIYLRWFAVCIFLIVSGFLLSGSVDKLSKPFAQWYSWDNLRSRILRFYIPLVPVYLVGILYKVFVLGKEYGILEFVVRFFLGGFKPGSYYIVILAQLVLVFPLIHCVVKKFRFGGVMICVAFTFLYDVLAQTIGMNPVAYKFLIFRLTTHIAFGVYARYADFRQEKVRNIILFILGLVYAVCCMYTDMYNPPIFFQWQEASFPTAFYLYPVIMWFITEFSDVCYSDSSLSRCTMTFANSTYHIFLIQLLYFTTFGFDFNAFIDNAAVSMPLNVIITVPLGILYYRIISPVENKIILNK